MQRPGAPGMMQLNPFMVRRISMLPGMKMPRIAGVYPGRQMMMPGMPAMKGLGQMGMPKAPTGMSGGMGMGEK